MKYRPIFLDSAISDLDCIEEYLSQFYPSTVRNFIDQLEEKVSNLEDMPYMYPIYEDDPFYRWLEINGYLVFYNVDESRNLVIIHRIIHGKRNISNAILEAP